MMSKLILLKIKDFPCNFAKCNLKRILQIFAENTQKNNKQLADL